MRERYQSMTTADGWIICGKCGHKLARVDKLSPVRVTGRGEAITGLKIEFKCTSCKMINVWEVER